MLYTYVVCISYVTVVGFLKLSCHYFFYFCIHKLEVYWFMWSSVWNCYM